MRDHDEYASPSPTVHDTVAASPLGTPNSIDLPLRRRPNATLASPVRGKSAIPVRTGTTPDSRLRKNNKPEKPQLHSRESSGVSFASSLENHQRNLDSKLDGYTLDFSKFSNAQFDLDEDKDSGPLSDLKSTRDEVTLSDVGGPEDFTANMEKYLFGEVPTEKGNADDNRIEKSHKEGKEEGDRDNDPQHDLLKVENQRRVPAMDDEADLGEYSEFGPPVDMSTPSHLMRRNGEPAKDRIRLENVEEHPHGNSKTIVADSLEEQKAATKDHERRQAEEGLRQQVADLQRAVKDRDEQIEINRTRALETNSALEQVKHLQAEVERKTTLLEELRSKRDNEALLREQIELLQKQGDEKESLLQKSTLNVSEVGALKEQIGVVQKQIHDVQTQLESQHDDTKKQLQNQQAQSNTHTQDTGVIASLRQQLSSTQEQLSKRDSSLEETMAKLREVTTAKETQLHQKNGEIDDLKAQNEEQLLDVERLETDIEQANSNYRNLENRILLLEDQSRPLEEKNNSLEAEMMAQKNALRAVAADLPIQTGGSTFTEILDLIKDLGQSNQAGTPQIPAKEAESEQPNQKLVQTQTELEEVSSTKKAVDSELTRLRQQAVESQNLINTIEGENSHLTARVDGLTSTLEKIQVDHAEALETVERLMDERNQTSQPQQQRQQYPSPPTSPPRLNHQDTTTLQQLHQTQLETLRTAHATTLSTLSASHTESVRGLRDQLAATEERESILRSELQALRASSTSQESQIQILDEEIQRLQSIIAIKDDATVAVDQRIARSLEKREKEWQRRVDLLLRERDRMGKALMIAWTEKEAGENNGGKMGDVKDLDGVDPKGVLYRYRYAQKNGGKKV